MDIINILNYQLSQIENLLNEDLQVGTITVNYLICEDSTIFLDKYALQTYITERKIENNAFLKTIYLRCKKIKDLWNNDIHSLPMNLLKEPFIFSDFENEELPIYYSSTLNFHAILLMDGKFNFYSTDLGKREFIKQFNYKSYSVDQIIQRCNLLLSWLKESIIEEDIEQKNKQEFTFENKFDKTKPNDIYEYFNSKLVEKGYLSKVDLQKYLVCAFQDETPPKNRLTFSKIHRGNIRNIFYNYFHKIATNSYGRKIEYAKLLGEYFNDFDTKKVFDNFEKVRN